MAVQDKDKLVSLEDLKTAYDDLDEDISDVRNTLNHKADVIYDTASGDIASFPDGADGLPVKDLTVGIEPVQDLHGYANPWPAGGGKNILQLTLTSADTVNGITFTPNADGTIKVSGTASGNAIKAISGEIALNGNYTLSGCPANGGANKYALRFQHGNVVDLQDEGTGASGSIDTTAAVNIVVWSGQTVNLVFKPMICLSSATNPTTFAPYSNICPISGWTGCNVTRTGENTIDTSTNQSWAIDENGNEVANGTINRTDYIPVTGAVGVFKSIVASGYNIRIHGYNSSKTWVQQIKVISTTGADVFDAFAIPSGIAYIRISYPVAALSTTEFWQGTTIPISWQSSAGTVYGGTLDVTTGVLTVDRASVTANNNISVTAPNAGWSNQKAYGWVLDNAKMPSSVQIAPEFLECSHGYKVSMDNIIWSTDMTFRVALNGGTARMPIDSASTVSEAKQWMIDNNIQIVYELATPQTYQLTPAEVTTLLGQNNIWADTGDSTVEYLCDTKLYIDKKLAALVAALS